MKRIAGGLLGLIVFSMLAVSLLVGASAFGQENHEWSDGAFLAGSMLNKLTDPRQKLLKWFPKIDDCFAAAAHLNKTSEWLRSPESRAVGAEFVCLPITRAKSADGT